MSAPDKENIGVVTGALDGGLHRITDSVSEAIGERTLAAWLQSTNGFGFDAVMDLSERP